MSSASRERFLFVVTVNTVPSTDPTQPLAAISDPERLDNLKKKLEDQGARTFIDEVQVRFKDATHAPDLDKAGPGLLAIDWYRDTFVGVVEVNVTGVVIEVQSEDLPWEIPTGIIQHLVQAIFAPLNEETDGEFGYLIWSLVRLQDLCADTIETFSLLGMKGIGGRK